MTSPSTGELLWGTARPARRGPKPALTLGGIVDAAIGLADADGLANLSMQRLAERLGFTKMSLYRYVPGKEQLTALMLDAAMGEPPSRASDSWRAGLRDWAHALFTRYRAHPWALELAVGPRPIGPNEMGWLDAALRAMDGTGMTGPERLDTVVLLSGHVRALAQQLGTASDDVSADRIQSAYRDTFAAAGDRYPAVLAAFAEEAEQESSGAALDFGIDRILDGLAALIANRAISNPPTPGSA
ncbi:TetR/AcrR family transcriptional regulator C-terminal domain-containing protein [Nocardia puris]|uniref:TetR/AcrR family transcriptional regulator n=1 Tax=Nocardia puris TaxID=208602 RepID=UPI001893D756|nr:TetR/AcrR family transcriptional regulator [Nocardia puris]MBF6210775.1 TetR/AcrR family transcriptional regulator C-terminal domain-containing protein [Nocardia puris]